MPANPEEPTKPAETHTALRQKPLPYLARRRSGFSLIELLIVMTVVAILAAIAYPGYRQYVLRAQRAEARAALIEAAQFMERLHSVNYRYDLRAGPTADGASAVELPQRLRQSPAQGPPHHRLSVLSASADTYVLQASPVATDDACSALTLDQTGARGAGGVSGNTAGAQGGASIHACWR